MEKSHTTDEGEEEGGITYWRELRFQGLIGLDVSVDVREKWRRCWGI